MTNKIEAITKFLTDSPHAGKDTYINFVTDENNDDSTSLLSTQYGKVVRRYTDGECLINLPIEIRQSLIPKKVIQLSMLSVCRRCNLSLNGLTLRERQIYFPTSGIDAPYKECQPRTVRQRLCFLVQTKLKLSGYMHFKLKFYF